MIALEMIADLSFIDLGEARDDGSKVLACALLGCCLGLADGHRGLLGRCWRRHCSGGAGRPRSRGGPRSVSRRRGYERRRATPRMCGIEGSKRLAANMNRSHDSISKPALAIAV